MILRQAVQSSPWCAAGSGGEKLETNDVLCILEKLPRVQLSHGKTPSQHTVIRMCLCVRVCVCVCVCVCVGG